MVVRSSRPFVPPGQYKLTRRGSGLCRRTNKNPSPTAARGRQKQSRKTISLKDSKKKGVLVVGRIEAILLRYYNTTKKIKKATDQKRNPATASYICYLFVLYVDFFFFSSSIFL